MLVRETFGKALTVQTIAPANTVTSIDDTTYKYEERKLAYSSGGTTVMAVGDLIVGATGGATAIIVARTIASGTDALGTAAGVLTIKCQVGVFQSEKLKVEADSDVATITAESVPNMGAYVNAGYKGKMANAVLVVCEDYDCRFTMDGSKPSQTNKVGQKLAAGQSYVVEGIEKIKNFKCIDETSGSTCSLKVVGFF